MPKAIDALPKTSRGRERKYDYRELMKVGNKFMLEKGKDFDCEPTSIRPAIVRDANEAGVKVKTRIVGDDLAFEVIPADSPTDNGKGEDKKEKADKS